MAVGTLPGESRIARIMAGARRAASSWYDSAGEPGPEFQSTPFEPGQTTAPIAALKLLTTIASARRSEANWRAAQESKKATALDEHDKTQAEIGRLNADTARLGREDLPKPAAANVGFLGDDGSIYGEAAPGRIPFTDAGKLATGAAALRSARLRGDYYKRIGGDRDRNRKVVEAARLGLQQIEHDADSFARAQLGAGTNEEMTIRGLDPKEMRRLLRQNPAQYLATQRQLEASAIARHRQNYLAQPGVVAKRRQYEQAVAGEAGFNLPPEAAEPPFDPTTDPLMQQLQKVLDAAGN